MPPVLNRHFSYIVTVLQRRSRLVTARVTEREHNLPRTGLAGVRILNLHKHEHISRWGTANYSLQANAGLWPRMIFTFLRAVKEGGRQEKTMLQRLYVAVKNGNIYCTEPCFLVT